MTHHEAGKHNRPHTLTTLLAAIAGGNVAMVVFLINQGFNLKDAVKSNENALTLAVSRERVDMIKFILGQNLCTINESRPSDGSTALHVACWEGQTSAKPCH